MTGIKVAEPIEFQALGDTFSLKMGFAATCALEEAYNRGFFEILSEVMGAKMRMSDLLTVFHCTMQREDSNGKRMEDVTRDEAAAIVDELGVEKVLELIGRAIEESPFFAKAKVEKPKVRGAGPAKKKAAA